MEIFVLLFFIVPRMKMLFNNVTDGRCCNMYSIQYLIRSKDEIGFTFYQLPYTTGIYRMICIQHQSLIEGGSLFLPASRITTEAQFCPQGKDGKIIKDEEGHTRRTKLIEIGMIINTVVPQRRSITYYYFS